MQHFHQDVCYPLIYKMFHPKFIVFYQKGEAISIQRVKSLSPPLHVHPYSVYASRGEATYTQNCKCVHIWTKHMERFYHSSDGFWMLCVQNVCVEPIKNLSKSNFDRIGDDVGIIN